MYEPSKKDWKLYREKIAGWQESYMERLVKQYADYLSSDLPASTKFWELEKMLKTDRRSPGVCIEMRRSTMLWDIISLINDDVIHYDDLAEFSDELKGPIQFILGRQKREANVFDAESEGQVNE